MTQDVVLSAEEAQALRDSVEVITSMAEGILDACTDFNATLAHEGGRLERLRVLAWPDGYRDILAVTAPGGGAIGEP